MTPIQRASWLVASLVLAACSAAPAAPPAPNAAPPAPPAPPVARLEPAASSVSPEIEAYRPAVLALLKEGLARGQAYSKLAELVAVAPHRLAGSAGAAAAVAWCEERMRLDGLDNVRLVPCMVPHWERGEVAELEIVAPAQAAGERLPILALGGSVATPPVGVTAEILEVKSWMQLDERAAEVAGRIVFYNRPMDPELFSYGAAYGGAVDQRGRGAIEAGRRGGFAAIVRSMTTRLDDFPHTGAMRFEPGGPNVPGVAVSTLGAERLAALLAQGPVRVRLALDSRWLPDAPSASVVGEVLGRELPDEVVVLGGHLDAWDAGQGAHDDGGGCMQAVEALRLIKALGLQPRRTVRAVLFMNEENGSRGALAYRDSVLDQLDRHVLAIESDGGVSVPRGFGATCPPAALDILRQIVALMEPAGIDQMRQGGGGADIDPLRESGGVPVMSLNCDGQRYFDLHHSGRDTLDAVWPREINLGAAAMAAMAYVVADMEQPLPRDPPPAPAAR
jgi:hypothetical protein